MAVLTAGMDQAHSAGEWQDGGARGARTGGRANGNRAWEDTGAPASVGVALLCRVLCLLWPLAVQNKQEETLKVTYTNTTCH